MIAKIVEAWEKNKHLVRKSFEEKHPSEYIDIVKAVVQNISGDPHNGDPEFGEIHEINDGDYQGTLLYVIAGETYQPSKYYCVKVDYGSCSHCDTLQRIQEDDDDERPTESQVNDYMTLALHIVQGLKEI